MEKELEQFNALYANISQEVSSIIVGQSDAIRLIVLSIFAGGHVLLEGSPGVGKTLMVKTLSHCLGLGFQRIQFTSDLMPSDITGTQILIENESGQKQIEFRKGPIFSQVVLADEINRAGPKTQSALLEAMEEKQVTVLGQTLKLPQPFVVLATQNPIELEGTYPLPEAQLDRFLVKLIISTPNATELGEILNRTTGVSNTKVRALLDSSNAEQVISHFRNVVRKVIVPNVVQDYLVQVVFALSPENSFAPNIVRQYVRYAPGPRGAQSTLFLAKALALSQGRINVSKEDVKIALIPCLRHRLILNFNAEAEGIGASDIINEVASV